MNLFESILEEILNESEMEDNIKKKYKIDKVIAGSAGYSEANKAWYGWSHRGLGEFKVGHTITKGHVLNGKGGYKVGDKAKTLDDCKKMALAFSKAIS